MTPPDSHREVHFPEKDQPLRLDVGALGELVGQVIQEQAGQDLFQLVESVRTASIKRREEGHSCEALRDLLGGRDPSEVRELVRAFSTYFQVVNLAEQVHRIRRGRDHLRLDGPPQQGSIADAVLKLKESGLDAAEIADLFDSLLIEPVFTAHPTEATRRTILEKQRSIAERLLDRLNPARTPREEETLWARIRTDVTSAWQTKEQPTVRPSVADEREHVLFYLITVL
ncbi:MAG: phosphoenolpyruvate carboxylase, partial [Longimicrobiales bacterium]